MSLELEKQPIFDVCFSWIIPNLYIFTKWFFHHFHPLKTARLGLFRCIYMIPWDAHPDSMMPYQRWLHLFFWGVLECPLKTGWRNPPAKNNSLSETAPRSPSGEIRTIPRWRIQKRRSCPVRHRPCASGRNPRFSGGPFLFFCEFQVPEKNWEFSITTWWFQTQLKNMIVKLDHVPKDQGENKQNVWNHHQDYDILHQDYDKFGCVFSWRLFGCITCFSYTFRVDPVKYIATRIPLPWNALPSPCLITIRLMVQKSGIHQLRLVVYPIIYGVLCIPGGAGFLPSTVSSTFFCKNLFFTPFFCHWKITMACLIFSFFLGPFFNISGSIAERMVLNSKVNSNSRQFLNLAIEGHLGIPYSFTLFNHGIFF